MSIYYVWFLSDPFLAARNMGRAIFISDEEKKHFIMKKASHKNLIDRPI